jgi:hypothetical protein
MNKFIKQLLFFSLPILLISPVYYFILMNSSWDNFKLINFQVKKLKKNKGKHYNTIYMGDSSGGCAISTSNDSSSINLCLSGSFGYEGQNTFIDVVNDYITYDTIVVINNIEIPTQPVTAEAKWVPELYSGSIQKSVYSMFKSLAYSERIIGSYFLKDIFLKDTGNIDYPHFWEKTKLVKSDFKKELNVEKLAELKLLDDKLTKSRKQVYLMFGPSLSYDTTYFKTLCNEISKLKIKHMLNKPFLLTEKTKGNTQWHISPYYIDSTTGYYKNIMTTHN